VGGRSLALKLKDVKTEIIEEDNGTYAVVCSALGVYSVGRTLREAKRNFQQALDLHLSVLREKATSHAVRAGESINGGKAPILSE
jgi:predicted RNase H-like HicB family nuclease